VALAGRRATVTGCAVVKGTVRGRMSGKAPVAGMRNTNAAVWLAESWLIVELESTAVQAAGLGW
jgi:hypothetical protein